MAYRLVFRMKDRIDSKSESNLIVLAYGQSDTSPKKMFKKYKKYKSYFRNLMKTQSWSHFQKFTSHWHLYSKHNSLYSKQDNKIEHSSSYNTCLFLPPHCNRCTGQIWIWDPKKTKVQCQRGQVERKTIFLSAPSHVIQPHHSRAGIFRFSPSRPHFLRLQSKFSCTDLLSLVFGHCCCFGFCLKWAKIICRSARLSVCIFGASNLSY